MQISRSCEVEWHERFHRLMETGKRRVVELVDELIFQECMYLCLHQDHIICIYIQYSQYRVKSRLFCSEPIFTCYLHYSVHTFILGGGQFSG